MAKPFNRSFKILEAHGFVVINGEQVTKVVANRVPNTEDWEITFHMSDGSSHTIHNRAWSKTFIDTYFAPVPERA